MGWIGDLLEKLGRLEPEMAKHERRDPEIIAADIVEDLQAALAQFAEIASDGKR
jgi:hypothetical protein